MKQYEAIKIELYSFESKDDILSNSVSGPFIFSNGAIDGELDIVRDEIQ